MPFLIDGHNLIAKLPDMDLSDPDDEMKLILRLRGLAARTRKRYFVIFDEGLPGGKSPHSTPSVQVSFASSRQSTADDIIRERISEIPDPANWTVVSSDNEVLAAATGNGMRAMKCRKFAKKLAIPSRPEIEAGTEVHLRVSQNEVDDLLAEFEALDPASLPELSKPKKQRKIHHPQPDEPDDEQPVEKMASSNKKRRVEPRFSPEMKDSDDAYLTRNDVATWQQLFNESDSKPLPPLDKPREHRGKYTEEGEIAPRRPDKNRHRKQNRENIVPEMKYDDELYLSQEDVDEWLNVFGDDDN